jgi:hypothetical protein
MDSKKCLGCDNMVPQTEKKRAKLYCSDMCRQKVWQEKRRLELAELRSKKEPDHVHVELPSGAVAKVAPDALNTMTELAKNIKVESTIEEQIKAIKAEKVPSQRDTPMGRKSWAIDQRKRIQELENKIK